MVPVQYNPSLPEVRGDPYPLYKRLREEDPVHWSEILDAWVVTRYDDVVAVLKGPRFSAERRRARNQWAQQAMAMEDQAGPLVRGNTMLTADPPVHTRLRLLVSKAFLPRAVERLRPHIQQIADELLDAVQDAGRMDIIQDFAYLLPVIVIAELLGVSPEHRAQFRRWSDDVVATLGGPLVAPELLECGRKSVQELAEYFRAVIADRRRAPKDDLVSVLVAAAEKGDVLSEEQLLATCVVMLIAGNETTRNLIGNGVLALLRNPEQLERLWQDRALVESAVEELLRYAGPVHATARVAREDIEIDGKTIREGQLVFTMLAAANRDPAHFPDPEKLDITRPNNHHVAFGFGIHSCLGQPLARLEARIAFDTLARRFPNPRLATDQMEWGPSFILRGLKSLPIAFGSTIEPKMAEFVTVANLSELGPGQLKQVELADGTQVCLANVDGAFYAIAGRCTHMGGPLGEGALDGTIVTCPWHGAMFDVTSGEVQGPPADDSEPKYEVRVKGDEVQVAVA